MKLLQTLGLAALLWLTGCASTLPVSPTAEAARTAAEPPLAPPHQAVIPDGHMQPLTAAQLDNRLVTHLEPPADLWERIRRGFAMPDLQSVLVDDRERYYASRPEYLARMTDRSRKYLFHIVEELERRNMPTELALLPFIESAFNPQAVSSAKAAGMWQFMPATGRHYDLKQNVFRDDRRDVLESTRAALDYLQRLYGMFGDWHLALAAYNWGEGSVSRALLKNRRAGRGLSYTDLQMPTETRYYVPKLQAVKNIIADPDAFNTQLPLIENHPYFQSVDISRDIDVALAARLAEVDLDGFKALNPSLHRPVILAAGTPQILLPWDNATIFKRNLDAYPHDRLASWTAWIAPTTMKSADVARRVGMDEDELRSVNQIPPRMLIRAGSTLLVPRTDRIHADVTSHIADNGQVSFAPEGRMRRTVVRARQGESLESLARRYKVSSDNIASWNKISSSARLKKGQSLVVYVPDQAKGRSTGRQKPSQVRAKPGKTKVAAKPRKAPVKRTNRR